MRNPLFANIVKAFCLTCFCLIVDQSSARAECASFLCSLVCETEIFDRGLHLGIHFTTEAILCDFFGGETEYTLFAENQGKRVAIQRNGYEEGLPGQNDYVEFHDTSPTRLQITYPMALSPTTLTDHVGNVTISVKIDNLGWTKNWLAQVKQNQNKSK